MTKQDIIKVGNFLQEHFESYSLYAFDFEGNIDLFRSANNNCKTNLALDALVEKDLKRELIYNKPDDA